MKKTELLKELEARFLKNHYAMDLANEEGEMEKASKYAHASCELAEIIGLVKFGDSQIDQALEYLYKKYNLSK